jgi:hypothetical protein
MHRLLGIDQASLEVLLSIAKNTGGVIYNKG